MKRILVCCLTIVALVGLLSREAAGADVTVSSEYVLGPGDAVSINDLSAGSRAEPGIAPILPDGTLVTSYTGVIQAAGLSLEQLSREINQSAKQRYENPLIKVSLHKQRPTQLYVLGEVVHPGLYALDPSLDTASDSPDKGSSTDAKADVQTNGTGNSGRLSNVLSMAGGVKEGADVRHIRVTRLAPKQTFLVDLWNVMFNSATDQDVVMQPGDVIYVPKSGAEFNASNFGKLANAAPSIRVFGSVKSPGLVVLKPGDDVISLITKCGGFKPSASTKAIQIERCGRDGSVTSESVNLVRILKDGQYRASIKLLSGDMIVVKESRTPTGDFGRRGDPRFIGDFGPNQAVFRQTN